MSRLAPKGILDYEEALRHLRIHRTAPPQDLADLVECHWEVTWDLPAGMVHRQRNLSHASVTLTWESDGAWVYGVPGKVFTRESSGSGYAFGVKFRSGAARAFFPTLPIADLSGLRAPLRELVSPGLAVEGISDPAAEFSERVALANGFCRSLRKGRAAPTSVQLATGIESDRSLLRAETVAERAGISLRELQRLFRFEVGITPKETIRRFRLQQAADRIQANHDISCLHLALELGYFDQAHFARDFSAVVGTSPDAYRKRVRKASILGARDSRQRP